MKDIAGVDGDDTLFFTPTKEHCRTLAEWSVLVHISSSLPFLQRLGAQSSLEESVENGVIGRPFIYISLFFS